MVFFAPVLAELSTHFGPAEYFALTLFAFIATSSVVADSVPKGLASLVLGLGIATVGIDAVTGTERFTLGAPQLFDGISIVVLTMAIVEPMVRQAGIDLIWFGIFVVIVVEMAQITPPIGFNLFVLQGMTGHSMSFIARATAPMFLIMLAMIFLIIAFPELATWLPDQVRPVAGTPMQ